MIGMDGTTFYIFSNEMAYFILKVMILSQSNSLKEQYNALLSLK